MNGNKVNKYLLKTLLVFTRILVKVFNVSPISKS